MLGALTTRKPVKTDPAELLALAAAANAVLSFDVSMPFAEQEVAGTGFVQGRLGGLAQALTIQGGPWCAWPTLLSRWRRQTRR